MSFVLGLVIGAVIGWQFPQPEFVKTAIEWVKSKINKPAA